MKIHKIKDNDELEYRGFIFTVELIDNKAKFKFVRKHDGKKGKEFVPPTKTEMMDYAAGRGHLSSVGATAWDYYNELGWKDKNRDQVSNWKAKMISTWLKESNKIKTTATKEEMVR